MVNFLTGATDTVQANGDAVVGLVAGGLYSPFAFTDWPELLTDLESGDRGALRSICRWIEPTKHSSPPGCSTRSNATRRYPSPIPTRSTQHHQRIPLASTAKRSVMATRLLPVLLWAVSPTADPVSTQPVTSNVPTLVLAGEFDPVTPPAWSALAAETLSNSQYVLLSGESHGVSTSDCGNSIIQEFLADPSGAVDTSCAGETRVSFLEGASDETVELERVLADFSVGETPILQPAGWTTETLGGVVDSRRAESLLDIAEVLQFSGPSLVRGSLEGLIVGSLGIELGQPAAANGGWTVRTGTDDGVAVDFYQRERDARKRRSHTAARQ